MLLAKYIGKSGQAVAMVVTGILSITQGFSQTRAAEPLLAATEASAPLPPFPAAPEQNANVVAAPVEPRVREAWLHECRRRLYANDPNYRDGFYIGQSNRTIDKQKNQASVSEARRLDYDYCDAYFDDYYRNYKLANLKQITDPATQSEIITEEYAPVPKKKSNRRRSRRM